MASRMKNITVLEWNQSQRQIRRFEGQIENLVGDLHLLHDRIDLLVSQTQFKEKT